MTTRVDLEGIMLSEISQSDKDKYSMISLISGIWKNAKLIDTENRSVVAREGKRRVDKMGEGGQKVQTSSYMISPWDVIYSMWL